MDWLKAVQDAHNMRFHSSVQEVYTQPTRLIRQGDTPVPDATDTRLTSATLVSSSGSSGYASNGEISVLAGGLYMVVAHALFPADADGWRQLWLRHVESATDWGKVSLASAGGSVQTGLSTSFPIQFANSDRLSVWARQNSNNNLSVSVSIAMWRVAKS